MRLCGVLDDRQSVRARDVQDWVHVCRVSVEMHRDDCLGPFGHDIGETGGVERERVRCDVYEPYRGTGFDDGRHGRDKREGYRDDLVARADTTGAEREIERAGSRLDADAVFHAAIVCELGLEGFDFRPQRIAAASQNPHDGGLDVGADRVVLCFEVYERNHGVSVARYYPTVGYFTDSRPSGPHPRLSGPHRPTPGAAPAPDYQNSTKELRVPSTIRRSA